MSVKSVWQIYRDVWAEKIVRFNSAVGGAIGLSALIVLLPIALFVRLIRLHDPPLAVVVIVLVTAVVGIIILGRKLGPWSYRIRSIFLLRLFGVHGTFLCSGALSLVMWLVARNAPTWVLVAPAIAWSTVYFVSGIVYEY